MALELTWWGHGTWRIQCAAGVLVLDPFCDDNPASPVQAAEVECQWLLVSHGHFDHIADAAAIARRTGATVVANFEICTWLGKQGVRHTEPMNLGGAVELPFGRALLTPAWHSSQLPDGSDGGNPGGFLLTIEGRRLYFAGDTALFSDMRLYAHGCDLAVLPIGDRYTMGPEASLAAVKLIEPRRVAPAHYNTWPPIAQDAAAWAERVRRETSAEPLVPQPGETITLD